MKTPENPHAGSTTAPARAPRGTLSRGAIVDLATKIMDKDGVEAVTVRRLAKELGVRPMALYTYFRSKDDILGAVYSDLLSRLELPDSPEAGLAGVREVVHAYFHLLIEHSALIRLNIANDISNAGDLKVSEAIYALLLQAGLERKDAVGVAAALMRFTLGSASLYPARHNWDADADYWSRVKESLRTLPAERYPALRSFGDDLPEFTQEQVFAYGVDAILDRFEG
ncbi:MAG: TetR family transcriptional regulator [Nitriliruptorales bacterium]|nr:TetR family transcriptional regulator [Nitriliruptorales bacterium]